MSEKDSIKKQRRVKLYEEVYNKHLQKCSNMEIAYRFGISGSHVRYIISKKGRLS